MKLFNVAAALAWLLLVVLTVQAVRLLGSEQGMIFISDFAHPWRAQFNTDFSLHVLFIMAWVIYRERSPAIGLLCSLGCLMGGLFTFPYLIVAALRAGGDPKKLLLGRHA